MSHPELHITEVRITLREEDKLRAFVSITLNDSFVIRGLKIIEGNGGIFVAMPSRKRPDGQFQDIAHPITHTMRSKMEELVISEYNRERARQSLAPSNGGNSALSN